MSTKYNGFIAFITGFILFLILLSNYNKYSEEMNVLLKQHTDLTFSIEAKDKNINSKTNNLANVLTMMVLINASVNVGIVNYLLLDLISIRLKIKQLQSLRF